MRLLILSLLLASCTGEFEPEPRAPMPFVPAVHHAIALNEHQTCIVDSARHVRCRHDADGTWRVVPSLSDVEQIAMGHVHACALAKGNVWCWGRNPQGQIGDGTRLDRYEPVWVVSGAVHLAAGDFQTCVVLANKSGACWGSFAGGPEILRPTKIDGLPPVRAIASNAFTACAIDDRTGTPWCWGSDSFGLRGNGWGSIVEKKPTAIADVAGAVDIVMGGMHACVRHIDDKVTCWGSSSHRQVGGDKGWPESAYPRSLKGIWASALALGNNHSCAIIDRHAACWGSNLIGERGDVDKDDVGEPIVVPETEGALEIVSRDYRTCAVLATRTVRCWGGIMK